MKNNNTELAPIPAIVSFGITKECDLKCLHCYSDSGVKDQNELTTDEAKQVIDDVAAMQTKLIVLDGGEPTLRKDLFELIAYCRKKKLKTVIGSNGSNLTKDFIKKLKNSGCQGIALSLDGAKPTTHDEWRGVEGSWEKVIESANNCRKLGLQFQIAPLITNKNFNEFTDISNIAKDLGANALEIFDFVPSGRGRNNAQYELTTNARKELVDKIISLQKNNDMIFRVIGLPQYWVMVEKTVPLDEILFKFVRSCCAAGTRYITILPNGDVIPCMLLQIKLGNVREQRLIDIWQNSPILKKLRNRENLKGKCGICKYKLTCSGARCKAYEKTGDMLAEDPTCWFNESEIK